MPYTIRPAVPDDLPILLAQYAKLYDVLASFAFPFSLNTADLPGLLSAQMQSKMACVLVAERAHMVCGFVVAAVSRLDRRLMHPGGNLLGTVQDIFIEPDERGCGCASQLLQAAQDWFCESGVCAAESFVSSGNHPSAGFFTRHGFVRMGATFYKEL